VIKAYKAEGIVLARRNIGEADKLITIFTKQFGKKKVLAKGVRRLKSKRAPYLELCTHVSLILHPGKTFDYLTEVAACDTFSYLRTRLERIGFAYIALELTDKLTAEHQEAFFIFEQLREFLYTLNTQKTTRKEVISHLVTYKQELLGELGFIQKEIPLQAMLLDQTIESITETRIKSSELLTSIQKQL